MSSLQISIFAKKPHYRLIGQNKEVKGHDCHAATVAKQKRSIDHTAPTNIPPKSHQYPT